MLTPLLAENQPGQMGPEAVPNATDELKADRPGFTDPTDTIGNGVLQFESGFALTKDKGGARTLAGPSPSVRLGIGERLELRFGGDGYLRQPAPAGSVSSIAGASDYSASLKVRLWGERHWRPAVTFIPGLSLPLGDAAFSSGGNDPTAKFSWSKGIPLGLSVAGNAGISRITEDGRHFRQTTLTLTASRALAQRFSAFVEIYGASFSGPQRLPVRIVDGGVTRVLGKNIQLDCSFGRAVTREGPSWLASAGMVFRWRPAHKR